LADILPPIDLESVARWEVYRLGFEDFSLPDLVFFAMTRLRGIKGFGRGEKIAWSVDACFRDVPFQIALRKRGFELYLPEGTPEEVRTELVRRLKKAGGIAASCLRDTGQQQIEAGNVTIDNRFLVFEGAYRFFRTEAETRFETAQTGFAALFDPKVREAGYFAGAMINAYFSRLEHALVLAMAFTSFDPTNGALRKFTASPWDAKFAAAFDLATDISAKRARDILGRVKKDHRNPISHGGFDKKGTAFHFHVSGIAPVPAILSEYEVSIEKYVTDITRDQFQAVCGDLDECDRLLKATSLGFGLRYAEFGMSISFSAASREQYKRAAERPELFDEFLEASQTQADMHLNMDF
jgi:hypothetical protein